MPTDQKPNPIPWRWMNENTLVEDVGRRRVVITGGRNPGELRTCGPDGRLVPLDPASETGQLLARASQAPRLWQACISLNAALAAQAVGAPLPPEVVKRYMEAADEAIKAFEGAGQ